jgi:hypothetical protein
MLTIWQDRRRRSEALGKEMRDRRTRLYADVVVAGQDARLTHSLLAALVSGWITTSWTAGPEWDCRQNLMALDMGHEREWQCGAWRVDLANLTRVYLPRHAHTSMGGSGSPWRIATSTLPRRARARSLTGRKFRSNS